jgi:hypothetical protein
MSARVVQFVVPRLALAVVLTLGCPAPAQQTIELNKSSDTEDADATHTMPSAMSAPTSMFGSSGVSFDQLPGSPPPIMLDESSVQWKQFLNNRKNWALMTPREILGVPTLQSIMGVPELGDELGVSMEQRYLQRLDHEAQRNATNGAGRSMSEDLSRDIKWTGNKDEYRHSGSLFSIPGADAAEGVKSSKALSGGLAGGNRGQADSAWTSPFDVQEISAKQTAEQLKGMEEFRKLMNPSSVVEPAAAGFAAQTVAGPNGKARSAASQPAVHSYTSLEDTFGKPTALTLFGQPAPVSTAPKKAALVQPPPWMVPQSPSTPTFPQRQF